MLREKQFYKTFSVLALSLALHNLLLCRAKERASTEKVL